MGKCKKITLFAVCVGLLTLVGNTSVFAKTTVLRYGCVQSANQVYTLGAKKLAELVKERTKGEVRIDIYPDSRIGNNPSMLDQIKNGMLAMGVFPPGTLGGYDKRISILSLYYLFEDLDAMTAALDSPAMGQLTKSYEEKTGIKILGFLGGIERNIINSKRPIQAVADLKGLKMRAWSWGPAIKWWEDLGAIPSVISYSEIYTALQTGVVDGAENDISSIEKNKWVEVSGHMALTQHIYTIRPVVINVKRFQRLTPEQQQILVTAMKEAQEYQLGLAKKLNDEIRERIETKYHTEITTPDKTEFIKISRELGMAYAKEVGVEKNLQAINKLNGFLNIIVCPDRPGVSGRHLRNKSLSGIGHPKNGYVKNSNNGSGTIFRTVF